MFDPRHGEAFPHAAQARHNGSRSHSDCDSAEQLDPLQPVCGPAQQHPWNGQRRKAFYGEKSGKDKKHGVSEGGWKVIAGSVRGSPHNNRSAEAEKPRSKTGGEMKIDAPMQRRAAEAVS